MVKFVQLSFIKFLHFPKFHLSHYNLSFLRLNNFFGPSQLLNSAWSYEKTTVYNNGMFQVIMSWCIHKKILLTTHRRYHKKMVLEYGFLLLKHKFIMFTLNREIKLFFPCFLHFLLRAIFCTSKEWWPIFPQPWSGSWVEPWGNPGIAFESFRGVPHSGQAWFLLIQPEMRNC